MTLRNDRHAKLDETRGRVVPVQLAHIVRRTSRFEPMLKWYQTVLGAKVVHSDGVLAFLSYDAEHHRIAIAQIPGLEEQPAMQGVSCASCARNACSGSTVSDLRNLRAAAGSISIFGLR